MHKVIPAIVIAALHGAVSVTAQACAAGTAQQIGGNVCAINTLTSREYNIYDLTDAYSGTVRKSKQSPTATFLARAPTTRLPTWMQTLANAPVRSKPTVALLPP